MRFSFALLNYMNERFFIMALNQGKAFEAVFKKDWEKTFGDNSIDRIYDSVSGYATISNISDFIGYSFPNMF